jgi:hypothetical protein
MLPREALSIMFREYHRLYSGCLIVGSLGEPEMKIQVAPEHDRENFLSRDIRVAQFLARPVFRIVNYHCGPYASPF